MSGKLNKHAYQYLIDGNIKWLEDNTEDYLERQHIIEVLKQSVDTYYPPATETSGDHSAMSETQLDYRFLSYSGKVYSSNPNAFNKGHIVPSTLRVLLNNLYSELCKHDKDAAERICRSRNA